MQNLDAIVRRLLASAALGAIAVTATASYAQDDKPAKPAAEKKQDEKADEKQDDKAEEENGDSEKKADEPKEKKEKFIKDMVEDHEVLDGLFKLYRDPKTGELLMEIREDQIGKEFIYTSQTVNGVLEGGHFRGQYRGQKVIKINKYYNKIEITEENPYFYFDPNNNIARAKEANISNAVLHTKKIKAKSEDGTRYLIPADKLFKSEALQQIKPTGNPRQKPWEAFKLGGLSGDRTRISSIDNYPENTDITVDYVYSSASPLHRGNWFDITDARSIKVQMRHTLMAMPENEFKPRFDDARVGYFLDLVNDQTDTSATPWRDMINRWNLVKKDPTAAVSEPVTPIVWWIENTTPENLRPIIKKAVESWNIAFEHAGFKNAVQVRTQPDDADWDAGDIRYNTLRWTSSPQVPFGGYGPSFTNPRTGEILGADIMLEYSFLTNRLNASNIFETSALGLEAEKTTKDFIASFKAHEQNCNMAGHLQMSNMLGNALANADNAPVDVTNKLVEESIYYLMLHEVGHTLGLNHNMKATQARSYETAHDIEAQTSGLAGSVMDYPSINFAPQGKKQAHYYTVRPGDYDIWAIQFGYDPDMDDPVKRAAHLGRSNEKGLAFGNDADDMRAPGKGIDPRVNIYDMTDDAVQFAEDRLKLDQAALGKLQGKFIKDGDSYQQLRNSYLVLTGDMAWQGRVASRYIGGIYVDRSVAGQDGATAPYRPVDEAKQKQAMKLLRDHIFAPNAFAADPSLVQHLAIQRRGFFHGAGTEDPKMHRRATAIQANILAHIMHPATLMRITDSTLYGNTYTVTEVLGDLTKAIFEDDSRGAVNTYRQELQIHYVRQLIAMLKKDSYDYVARSNAHGNLTQISKDMARWRGDASTRAHRNHVKFLIDKALEVYEG